VVRTSYNVSLLRRLRTCAAGAQTKDSMLHWFRQIDSASSAGEIVAIARDYLATWTPRELAKLPRDCRPGRVKSAGDIEQLHACLVEEYRQNRLAGEELSALQRLTSFIVRASVRLAQFDNGGKEDHGAPRNPPGERLEGEREP
jgi:hypothetical protein